MQIAILAIGSRGDVQPYVALGKGLQQAGYAVRVVSHLPFEELVRGEGLDFASLGGDSRALVESHFQQSASTEQSRAERRGGMMEELGREMQEMTEKCWQASQDADVLLLSTFGLLMGLPIAQKLHIPAFTAYVQPLMPTAEFPPLAYLPPAPSWLGSLRPYCNLLGWKIMYWGYWHMLRRPALKAQKALDLPVRSPRELLSRLDTLVLYGYSPSFLPRPKDWPVKCHVTGYWFLDSRKEWQPPIELLDFLQAGPRPVYVGFGSMPDRDPQGMTDMVVQALERTGQRGILVAGGGALSRGGMPNHVFVLDSVPHDWLFPYVSAVVHHGGAGTTGAGLRAGKPTVIVPLIADQPFWGNQVYERGLGPKPIPHQRLSAETLADAIQTAVTDAEMRARAEALGEKIRAEDGIGKATELVCHHLKGLGIS